MITKSFSSFFPIDSAIFILASIIYFFSYLSIEPVILSLLVFIVFYGILYTPSLGGYWERKFFKRLFCAYLLTSAIAAVFLNQFYDPSQLFGDASSFYDYSIQPIVSQLSLESIRRISEGSLAIKSWSSIYQSLFFIGFYKEPYVGILVNILLVSFTGVITLRIARLIYGIDDFRFKQLLFMFAFCGLFWLLSSVHVRDSYILFFITLLVYYWISFLISPVSLSRFIQLMLASFISSYILFNLRGEFVFLPAALAIPGFIALLAKGNFRQFSVYSFLGILGLAFVSILLISSFSTVQYALTSNALSYSEFVDQTSNTGSLGSRLIVNQPFLIRIPLGYVYLFVFPIPFWNAFQFENIYVLFKGCNVIFFYFLIPLLLLSFLILCTRQSERSAYNLFLVFSSSGFCILVALTSLETRHFAVVLPMIFLLSLLPDMRSHEMIIKYKNLLFSVLLVMIFLHIAWLFIKL